MGTFGTEFHATPNELCDFIEDWLDQYPIVISAFAFPPLRRAAISRDTVREVLARPDINQITFTHGPVDPSVNSVSAVSDTGQSFLYLLIGRLKPNGLEQSSMSGMSDDPTWKKINRDLKRHTTAGADYVEDATGKVWHSYRWPRFTPGAKALHASGTPLRHPGGKNSSYRPK